MDELIQDQNERLIKAATKAAADLLPKTVNTMVIAWADGYADYPNYAVMGPMPQNEDELNLKWVQTIIAL